MITDEQRKTPGAVNAALVLAESQNWTAECLSALDALQCGFPASESEAIEIQELINAVLASAVRRRDEELAKLRGYYDKIVEHIGHDQVLSEYDKRGELLRDETRLRKQAEQQLTTAQRERDEARNELAARDSTSVSNLGEVETYCREIDQLRAQLKAAEEQLQFEKRQAERDRPALERIVNLSAGWDADGSLGPRSPLSWESVARIAMDYAKHALAHSAAPVPPAQQEVKP